MGIKLRLAIATVLLAPMAQAADLCPQDDATFRTALTLASIAPGSTRILLGAGKTFHLAGSPLDTGYEANFKPGGNLAIEGGYNADCSAVSTRDAATTVLDGTGSDDIVISTGNDFTLGTLTVSNLFAEFNLSNPPGGVGADGMRLRLLHTRFLDGANVRLGLTGVSDAEVRVENSLFARLSGLPPTGSANDAGALEIVVGNGAKAILIGNTISHNNRNGLWTFGAPVFAYDNILYGNNLIDEAFLDWRVHDTADLPYAVRNIVGSFNGSYLTGSNNNLDADPLFASATDFNLQPASPARESGTSAVPGGLSAHDVEGGDRVVGTTVDRGAYEADSSGATVLIVTNTNDSGAGSLRAAITDANANPVANVIGFNIPGACPRTIALDTELPTITDSASIRGYTQPGSQPNSNALIDNATICVELIEASGHIVANGLHFSATSDGDSFDVSGLSIGGFNTGVLVDGAADADFSIWGNFIGLAANGTTARANSLIGVNVTGHVQGAIGGSDAAQRNVIAQNALGVRLDGDRGSTLANNFIGTNASGSSARPNTIGVSLLSAGNEAGDNVISGNSGYGMSISGTSASDNIVQGNRIGLKAFALGDSALGNGDNGILIGMGASRSRILDNTIANNAGAGIRISGDGSVRNRITDNRIRDNGDLGIDLGATGVDPEDNDAAATDATPNHGQNAPRLSDARGAATSGHAYGQLKSANGTYRIDLYASAACDASGYGEGGEPIGMGLVQISDASPGVNGSAAFDLAIASPSDLDGRAITATATAVAGAVSRVGDTSEFGVCRTYHFVDTIFANGFEPAQP